MLSVTAFSLPAAAQGSFDTDTQAGVGMTPTWTLPGKLNWNACPGGDAVGVTFTPVTGAGIATVDAHLNVFFDSDGNCQGTPPDASDTNLYIADMTVPSDSTFLAGTTALDFPDGVEVDGDSLTFTTTDVYDHVPNACTETRQSRTSFALCVTVDMPVSPFDGPNGNIQSGDGDWYAWVKLTVDTMPPPAPDTPAVLPLDGRLRLSAEVTASGETDDIAKWRARIRPLDDATSGEPCDDWTDFTEATASDAGTSGSVEISAENGVVYEACVTAIDSFDNESAGSPVVTGTPQAECDFIECYPGNLKTGYCGATSAPGWAGLGVLLLLGRRKKVERDR
jgi:hypothetical protein